MDSDRLLKFLQKQHLFCLEGVILARNLPGVLFLLYVTRHPQEPPLGDFQEPCYGLGCCLSPDHRVAICLLNCLGPAMPVSGWIPDRVTLLLSRTFQNVFVVLQLH